MTPPLFSLSSLTEYGHNETIASFSSLKEAEEALSSLLSLRLPFLWLLLLRSRSSPERLRELRLPLP